MSRYGDSQSYGQREDIRLIGEDQLDMERRLKVLEAAVCGLQHTIENLQMTTGVVEDEYMPERK